MLRKSTTLLILLHLHTKKVGKNRNRSPYCHSEMEGLITAYNLPHVERILSNRKAERLLLEGVMLLDPALF